MDDLDLNLLYVLVALDDTHSVSGAALKLNRSQPAVSAALGKLREFFADPLFVRSGNRMEPTPRAAGLVASARAVLGRVAAEIVTTSNFDPATSSQTITLALSDVGEVVFLPTILQAIRRHVPRAAVRSVSLPAGEVGSGLENGSIDLALGYFPDLKKHNFFQQTLFSDTFACLMRADHPVTASKLSLKQFLRLEHAVVRAESRTEEVIERYLARKKLRRNIVLTTPHFASAPMIVAQSDLIVTVPDPLARYFTTASTRLRVVELPFDSPRIDLKQVWHRKFHHDARNRWLRATFCKLFQPIDQRHESLLLEHARR